MSVTPVYKHKPLTAPRTIRVLDIEPALNASADLRCELREVSLDDKPLPEYSALSYTWEGQVPDRQTFCAGGILYVTENCFAAMVKLRKPEQMITLWIDSICIDQASVAEKSVQVGLMGEIYKAADQVVVWLGEWDDNVRKAVEIIKDIGTIQFVGQPTQEQGLQGQRQMQAKVMSLKATTQHPADDVLSSLYHKNWFSRMWTVQEIVLARGNNVIIYNGPDPSEQLPWNILILATDALLVCRYEWVDLSRTVKLHKQLLTMILLERYPMMREVYKAKPGDLMQNAMVWPIMCDSRGKGATNVKDKVFALYGVFQELKIAGTLPAPDYAKSVEDIYRELTIACIESDKNLYVLFDAPSDHRHLRSDLASWAPDWSDPGWRNEGKVDSRIAVTRDRFCAAGPAQPTWSFSAQGRQLLLRGKVVDEIIFCGEPFCCVADMNTLAELKRPRTASSTSTARDEFNRDLQEAYTTLKSWVGICNWYDKYPATGETPAQAFRRLLTQDFPAEDNNDPDASLKAFNGWFSIMSSPNPDVEVFRTHHGAQLGHRKTDDAFVEQVIRQCPPETIPLAASQLKLGGSFHMAARTFSNRKGFFVTEGGRMGTAAARVESSQNGRARAVNLVKAGDKIAVVAGLEMPIILRPVAKAQEHAKRVYHLVTHAYVHGIMYGEAWADESNILDEIVLL